MTRHVCATSDYLLKHSHGPCLPVYQSCASTIVGSMVMRADDKVVEVNDGKTLHVVDKKAHKTAKASKTSAQRSCCRVAEIEVIKRPAATCM